MVSLYGIESNADCREKMDELLRLVHRANQTSNKETIAELKFCLEAYYKNGNAERGKLQMSSVEQRYFWPAVQGAYVHAPHLGRPQTWTSCLYEIESDLNYYRPKGK